ncbi:MAG: hypothetical protein ABMB14_36745 [Myxococcota bacterium]
MLILALSAARAAEPVPTYDALIMALEAGDAVRVVIHAEHCLVDSAPAPPSITGFTIDRYEAVPKGAIGNPVAFLWTTASAMVVDRTVGVALDHVRLALYEDGRAELVHRTLDRKNKIRSEDTYGCAIGPESGVTLFVDR